MRSFNYNIAVNIWFKHYSKPIDLTSCVNVSDVNKSIDKVHFIGMDSDEESDQADNFENSGTEDELAQGENALTLAI